MSFKIKRWAHYRSVDLASRYPGLSAVGTSGDHIGFAYPCAGKIICACYQASTHEPVWLSYNPATDSVDDGGSGPPSGSWIFHSGFFGDSTRLAPWGDNILFGYPQGAEGYGRGDFYGWQDGAFWCGNNQPYDEIDGLSVTSYWSIRLGTAGGAPSVMVFSRWGWGPTWDCEWGVVPFRGGYGALARESANQSGASFYIPWTGYPSYDLRQLGSFYHGAYMVDDHGIGTIWAGIPYTDTAEAASGQGRFYEDPSFDPDNHNFGPAPGFTTMMKVEALDVDGETYLPPYWTEATAPFGSGKARTWETAWDFRLAASQLDEYDIDGTHHTPAMPMPCDSHQALGRMGNGWFFGLSTNASPLNFVVYVLDPAQPSARSVSGATSVAAGTIGWVGDYAIDTNNRLRHILPFPDDRSPEGGAVQPPQERMDGFVVGRREVFAQTGARMRYVRDLSIDLSAYPHGDDWNFPGEESGRYPGFWYLFAGGSPTVVGYMPDETFGLVLPAGEPQGLGAPVERIIARATEPTHVLRPSSRIDGTTFAAPQLSLFSPRTQLISALDGTSFVYTANGTRLGAKPYWRALAGRISQGQWQTTVDFDDEMRPDLGETDWTVWSVVPIPRCKPLPKGGFLVGATLYFAPWDVWEMVPGSRNATFKDTGKGWLPALLGWDGPLQNDDHAPQYLVAYDEWTVARSLYGPDALLVYDHEGEFVECLNSAGIHAPDGREIMVTWETRPRLIYRVYRHGTYSDYAEGFGQYYELGENAEIQAPLYVAYDLLTADGLLAPGCGPFHGFVHMGAAAEYIPQSPSWRWGVADSLYDPVNPKGLWSPPGDSYVRSGKGGGGVTLLGGNGSGRAGVRGPGARSA